jgi:hypothetical protein
LSDEEIAKMVPGSGTKSGGGKKSSPDEKKDAGAKKK